jgi:hypothetical protein
MTGAYEPGNGIQWRLENCEKQIDAVGRRAHNRMDLIDRRIDEHGNTSAKVAVLEERMANLTEEVHGLRRALWAFVFSVLSGAIIFMLSIVTGALGG